MIILVYQKDGGRRLFVGKSSDVKMNALIHYLMIGNEIRTLTGTVLSDAATIVDPRIPLTAAEFDAQYPDAPDWRELPD